MAAHWAYEPVSSSSVSSSSDEVCTVVDYGTVFHGSTNLIQRLTFPSKPAYRQASARAERLPPIDRYVLDGDVIVSNHLTARALQPT